MNRSPDGHDVVIVGGGPAGLTLAGELALAGVDAAVIERRPTAALAGSRSGGLHARTIEMLGQRGIADRFLSAGKVAQVAMLALIRLDISDVPSRYPHGLALWQSEFEPILAAWVDELKVPVCRSRSVTGFTQDPGGVDVELDDGGRLRARYLVGCDGGRSLVRKAAGIDFPGWAATTSTLIAEAELSEEPELGVRRHERGISGLDRLDNGLIRMVLVEREPHDGSDPTLSDLSRELTALYGTDFGLRRAAWISRFSDTTRQAAAYRDRRVLLAGDAAHVHSPAGGQGLNTGVQDAFNLGWKLAQVVKGTSPEHLLDTYHAERHPVGARVLQLTMAATALGRSDPRNDALRDTVAGVLATGAARRQLGAQLSGLDIRYDLGDGHPLAGRRMPDLDLETSGGPARVYPLLHAARPVLLLLGEPGRFDLTPWADRVDRADARYAGPWELPVVGTVPAAAAVLIRPDGYVAWAGDPGDPGLPAALSAWFGPPAA